MSNDHVHAQLTEQRRALLGCGQALQVAVTEHNRRVRGKGQHRCRAAGCMRAFHKPLQDGLMPAVDAVKDTDGQPCAVKLECRSGM